MIKLNKNALLIAVLLVGTIGFASCSSAPTTTNSGNNAVVVNKPANATTNVTKTETTTGDKIGVAECDEYIEKYEACINSKVPEAQRAMLKTSFEAQRKAFKDAAANPQAKAGLATGCKQAIETAKQSTSAYSCAW
ncbi:MAG: hypothetical protein M3Q78_09145 [Acidobacteriota bacterium]|nr:hypothetical protein [Acidobacteriota bacterium]